MAITLQELTDSKQQTLFNILFLNSEWLMSTWGDDLAKMASKAIKIEANHLQGASISIKKRDCKSKDKSWVVASCRVTTPEFTLVFDLPESFLPREDESSEDHQTRLRTILPALTGKVFAPRGSVDPKAGKAV